MSEFGTKLTSSQPQSTSAVEIEADIVALKLRSAFF